MIANTFKFEREHNARAWAVWHIATLSKAKRIPSLKKLQVKLRRRKPQQTWQQQDALLLRYQANVKKAKEMRDGNR